MFDKKEETKDRMRGTYLSSREGCVCLEKLKEGRRRVEEDCSLFGGDCKESQALQERGCSWHGGSTGCGAELWIAVGLGSLHVFCPNSRQLSQAVGIGKRLIPPSWGHDKCGGPNYNRITALKSD